MNGICIRFKGWMDIERLDGVGSLEYDEERGRIEEAILRDQIDLYTAGMSNYKMNNSRKENDCEDSSITSKSCSNSTRK